jgi:hypothetical protein
MLSLVDLLDAGSVNLPLAAYLGAAMRSGASLLVGAQPGGAGKTAVMVALLNFLPDGVPIVTVEGVGTLERAPASPANGGACYLAHEISSATYYYAYLWGREARGFFRLAGRGHTIASNLHADTLEETRGQLRGLGVEAGHLVAVELKVYLGMERRAGGTRRWLRRVYESDGAEDRLMWEGEADGAFARRGKSALVSPEEESACAELLEELRRDDLRHLDEVRRALTAS